MKRLKVHNKRTPSLLKWDCDHGVSAEMSNELVFSKIGKKMVMRLNRPKMRNAYSSYMEWNRDPRVQFVIVKGNDKAFSSGGEIRNVAGFGDHVDYVIGVTKAIRNFSKPYVALVDGMAMGGGLGLAVRSSFMVVTERAEAAMPEATLGYYPDAGSAHFLTGSFGLFMALTGFRLKGADICHIGLGTHYIKSASLSNLEADLLNLSDDQLNLERVGNILKQYHEQLPPFSLTPYLEEIDRCFSGDSVENIMLALKNENSEFSTEVLSTLQRMSPTSLKITLQHYRRANNLSFDEIMELEHRLTRRFVREHDFYEGVRAMILDKDFDPKWRPSRLEDVTQEMVDSYFNHALPRTEPIFQHSKI